LIKGDIVKVLVLGASGATGRLVANQLVRKGVPSRLVARENSLIPEEILNNKNVEIVRGNITEFDNYTHTNLISDCDAIVCCLGHNITFKGIFGKPRKLVYEAIKNICYAINKKGNHKYKIILMNTTGNVRKDETKNISLGERIILAILKTLLPPIAIIYLLLTIY
jgi:nucleoside-diphosphate-sugar epimerase